MPSLSEVDSNTQKWKSARKATFLSFQEYKNTINLGLETNDPSPSVRPARFFQAQRTNPILNGRPLNNNDIISAATDSYDNEDERMIKTRDVLSKKLGTISVIEYGINNCKDNGVITAKAGIYTTYVVLLEGKSEIGSDNADPSIQGAITVQIHILMWQLIPSIQVDKIQECCYAPSFIVAIAGPWVCVLGAVFLSRVMVQLMTDSIPLTVNLRNNNQVKRIARLFKALRIAFIHLSNFYNNLDLTSSNQPYFPIFDIFIIKTISLSLSMES
ncbi:13248_t:CDS:2 [Ambispora gerdemannii]|uniref:13248_t:CDS:1 n=1 Tax=Ambispora gerdemannii TaxID=144530 RepID=A0A9N9BM99_9GLOM|nr:13248_t:CDS:2 [Ambispora gerdemannii]